MTKRISSERSPHDVALDYVNHVLNHQTHDITQLEDLIGAYGKLRYDEGYKASARRLIGEGKIVAQAKTKEKVYLPEPLYYTTGEGGVWLTYSDDAPVADMFSIAFSNDLIWDIPKQAWRTGGVIDKP